jgi:hypothetical protein
MKKLLSIFTYNDPTIDKLCEKYSFGNEDLKQKLSIITETYLFKKTFKSFVDGFIEDFEENLRNSYNFSINHVVNYIGMELFTNPFINTAQNFLKCCTNDVLTKLFDQKLVKLPHLIYWLYIMCIKDLDERRDVGYIRYLLNDASLFYTRNLSTIVNACSYIAEEKEILNNLESLVESVTDEGIDYVVTTAKLKSIVGNILQGAIVKNICDNQTATKYKELFETPDKCSYYIHVADGKLAFNTDTEFGKAMRDFESDIIDPLIIMYKNQIDSCVRYDFVDRMIEVFNEFDCVSTTIEYTFGIKFDWRKR